MIARAALALALAGVAGGCGYDAPDSCGPLPEGGCTASDCLDCEGDDFYECLDGEWRFAYCDPAPLEIVGPLELSQTIVGAAGTCSPAAPRTPLVLGVTDDETLTAEPPTVVIAASIDPAITAAQIDIELTDEWGDGVTRTVAYDLEADDTGAIAGTATAGSEPDCVETLDVVGTWGP